MIREIKNNSRVVGIRVFETSWMLRGSGICLPGIGIFIHSSYPSTMKTQLIQHEYGHFLDFSEGFEGDHKRLFGSRLLGFYFLIGIPSLLNLVPVINRLSGLSGPHRIFWTELRANRLAKAHFGEFLADGFERNFPSMSGTQKRF